MDIEIRPVALEELRAWTQAFDHALGRHLREAQLESRTRVLELGRTLAAVDGGEIVGTTYATSLETSVPGASLSTARVDAVGVVPTHRRRGIMTRMMDRQLRDCHERGDVLAVLESAESIIYGRFGYGIGCQGEDWTIAREHTAFARPDERRGRLRSVSPEEARAVYPEVYELVGSQRPGVIRYNAAWWDRFLDDAGLGEGVSALFHVVYERGGNVEGYVMYRISGDTLVVVQLMAITDHAYGALWRYCFGVDLMSSTQALGRALDEPLPWMLADPRRLSRSLRDTMWLRLVDVRAALAGRRYATSGRLVIDVRDSFCPWNEGVIELEGGPEGAQCRPSNGSPDLTLTAADLAAAYLGAVRLETLSRAGRAQEHSSSAVHRADTMFATRFQPWSPGF